VYATKAMVVWINLSVYAHCEINDKKPTRISKEEFLGQTKPDQIGQVVHVFCVFYWIWELTQWQTILLSICFWKTTMKCE
jgi:hypothetical protein